MNEHEELSETTRLIAAAAAGDLRAKDELASLVYDELRRTAERLMRREPNQTLQATALVNEAILRLFADGNFVQAPDRAYFFAAAGQAMKRILVEAARRRKSLKRGGENRRQPLDDVLDQYERQSLDVSDLSEALSSLEAVNPRQSNITHLRWFLGMSVKEVAELLGISESTVEQDWRSARAFLKRFLG
jgi:RNA polymerase sigma factor (TIGR02999 family)